MSWLRLLVAVVALGGVLAAPAPAAAETGGKGDQGAPAGGTVGEGRSRGPRVRSPVAIVLEADTGAEVWSKDGDEVREIASMTKIFVALVLRQKRLKLDAWSTIGADDVAAAEGGARTRLPEGETFRNRDLLRAMLMVSDNRAPTALARAVGLDRDQLVAAMNAYAAALGLTHTHFIDPTGIEGNTSTARELARALAVVLDDKVLARLMKVTHVRIKSKAGTSTVEYRTTVQPLRDRVYTVRGGKTGHTDDAGYCLLVSPVIDGKAYVMAFLGGKTRDVRFDDFGQVANWIDLADGTSSATVAKAAKTPAAKAAAVKAPAVKAPAAKSGTAAR